MPQAHPSQRATDSLIKLVDSLYDRTGLAPARVRVAPDVVVTLRAEHRAALRFPPPEDDEDDLWPLRVMTHDGKRILVVEDAMLQPGMMWADADVPRVYPEDDL